MSIESVLGVDRHGHICKLHFVVQQTIRAVRLAFAKRKLFDFSHFSVGRFEHSSLLFDLCAKIRRVERKVESAVRIIV